MSLRDDVFMSANQLLESLDRVDDAGLQRCSQEISEYLRGAKFLNQSLENNIDGSTVASMYMRGNVLAHKLTRVKHVVTDEEMLDEYDVYDFICEQPHGDGDYSYKCYNDDCKCMK